MSVEILHGDALTMLRTLPSGSVQCIVTSPPYWGLRAYGTEPQVWRNGSETCAEHEWGGKLPNAMKPYGNQVPQTKWATVDAVARGQNDAAGQFCQRCGAWRGELGLEPTVELYVAHLVEVFEECRRVLRDDGTLWLNLGDSYFGGKGSNGSSKARRTADERGYAQSNGTVQMDTRPLDMPQDGLKPKDLIGNPLARGLCLASGGLVAAGGYHLGQKGTDAGERDGSAHAQP